MTERRVKRKQKIQIAGNPQYAKKPSRATPINNPLTGTASFGTFPAISVQGVEFEAGPIYLRYGEHSGPNRGWGLEHIWQAHFASQATADDATPLVASLLNSVLVPGATIHYEYGLGSAGERSTVFRGPNGVVVVERKFDGRNNVFYSIVTAFATSRVHGAIIGTL